MQSLMSSMGVEISKANNGQEAVDAVQKRHLEKCSKTCEMYKLILMDLSMPVMDGFKAALKLKELVLNNEVPYVPIVACTAFVDTDKMERCFECGMEDRISKPVSKNKIQAVLKAFNIPFSQAKIQN